MASSAMARSSQPDYVGIIPAKDEASGAGVSWPAVFAGAFTMGALVLILSVLGGGIGLSSVSPWPSDTAHASRVSAGAIIWLIVIQLIASSIGGYLAGRLRTKWVSLHTHEVYFRDTAHGFIAWSVAFVVCTLMFMSYAVSIASRPTQNVPGDYFVDMLFRTDHPTTAGIAQPLRNEAELILANALRYPDMGQQDQSYLANLVVATTGLSQQDADRRVADTVAADREATDTARKAVAHSLYWLFVALLIGAFCASYAATFGGRQRDNVPAPQPTI